MAGQPNAAELPLAADAQHATWGSVVVSVQDRTDALGKCQHLVDGGRSHLQADRYKAAS